MAPEAKKYAVIGKPVGHSLSPAMHNAAFKALGISSKAKYEAVEVEKLDKTAYERLRRNYSGINVTIPYKTAIIDFIDGKEMVVDMVGAVNCVAFEDSPDNRAGPVAKGYNTDMVGAVDALKTKVPKLKGKSVLVLGAGGAARAIVYGCALEGAKVSVHNRTVKKALELAVEVDEKLGQEIKIIDDDALSDLEEFDIIVNATSLGMSPKSKESPLPDGVIPQGAVVMDIVYNPLETKLLKQAKAAGAKTIDGVEMFVRQGAESLRIWGYEPPVEAMRKAVLERLK